MEKDYIKNQFVTYEIALKLKELGFNEDCLACFMRDGELYINNSSTKVYCDNMKRTLAPLWQQVIDWFMEKHGVYISIYPHSEKHGFKIRFKNSNLIHGGYSFYKEAREQAILKCIELCQNKKS